MIQSTLSVVIGFVFFLAFFFLILGLGGALLYIPVFKWVGHDFKSVALPTGLFLNGLTALSAFIHCVRSKMLIGSAFRLKSA